MGFEGGGGGRGRGGDVGVSGRCRAIEVVHPLLAISVVVERGSLRPAGPSYGRRRVWHVLQAVGADAVSRSLGP